MRSPPCPRCSTFCAGDAERCKASRDLQALLMRQQAAEPGRACDQALHDTIKTTAQRFLFSTSGWRPWDDGHQVLLLGECRRCSSTLAIRIRQSDYAGEELQ